MSVLNRLVAQRRAPRFLLADNGSTFSGPFTGHVGIPRQGADRLQPARQPTEKLHQDIQRLVQGRTPEPALVRIVGGSQTGDRAWRRDYNETRPHIALKELTPGEFVRQYSRRPTAEGS